jgi:hypothetical protein
MSDTEVQQTIVRTKVTYGRRLPADYSEPSVNIDQELVAKESDAFEEREVAHDDGLEVSFSWRKKLRDLDQSDDGEGEEDIKA